MLPPDIVTYNVAALFLLALIPGGIVAAKGQPFGFGYLLGLMCFPAALVWSLLTHNNNDTAPPAQQAPDLAHSFFSPSGRMGRQAFFGCYLVTYVATFLCLYAGIILYQAAPGVFVIGCQFVLAGVLAAMWAATAQQKKRLHDLNLPGTLAVALSALFIAALAATFVVPMLAWLLAVAYLCGFVLLLLAPGTPQANRYGQPPHAGLGTSAFSASPTA